MRAVVDERYFVLYQTVSDLSELLQGQVNVFVFQLLIDIFLHLVGADIPFDPVVHLRPSLISIGKKRQSKLRDSAMLLGREKTIITSSGIFGSYRIQYECSLCRSFCKVH